MADVRFSIPSPVVCILYTSDASCIALLSHATHTPNTFFVTCESLDGEWRLLFCARVKCMLNKHNWKPAVYEYGVDSNVVLLFQCN